jgi:hypothetical protein
MVQKCPVLVDVKMLRRDVAEGTALGERRQACGQRHSAGNIENATQKSYDHSRNAAMGGVEGDGPLPPG